MQKDMHFYGVYAMARAAGLHPDIARIVAHASQFVDDALEEHVVNAGRYGVILPVMTSHKPLNYLNAIENDQWNVWVSFHFLPGNSEGEIFEERLICQKDSVPANMMLEHTRQYAGEPFGPHLAGIAAHVYADTFSHYGFCGIHHPLNKVDGDSIDLDIEDGGMLNYIQCKFDYLKSKLKGQFAEIVPVGHGAVATYPDRPYLKWKYAYEEPRTAFANEVSRDNTEDFLEACQKLHGFFISWREARGDPAAGFTQWGDMEGAVRAVLAEPGDKDDRIGYWRDAMPDIFDVLEEDRHVRYDERQWEPCKIIAHKARQGGGDATDGELFVHAARLHRRYVLRELLPSQGLVMV